VGSILFLILYLAVNSQGNNIVSFLGFVNSRAQPFPRFNLFIEKSIHSYYTLIMKNLPLGIQTFRDMIEENYLYVDKTREIYNLFSDGKSISRLALFPNY